MLLNYILIIYYRGTPRYYHGDYCKLSTIVNSLYIYKYYNKHDNYYVYMCMLVCVYI